MLITRTNGKKKKGPVDPHTQLLVLSNSLQPHGLQPARLLHPWDSPGTNTGVGCHVLLQGIFLTQGSNSSLLSLLHWQAASSAGSRWEAQKGPYLTSNTGTDASCQEHCLVSESLHLVSFLPTFYSCARQLARA